MHSRRFHNRYYMDHWPPADEKYCSLATKLAIEGAIEHKFRLNIKRFISFFILSFNMKRFCIMFWIDIEHDIDIEYEKIIFEAEMNQLTYHRQIYNDLRSRSICNYIIHNWNEAISIPWWFSSIYFITSIHICTRKI